jgi:hypothetical protein
MRSYSYSRGPSTQPWKPQSYLDVLEPPVLLVKELLSRFRSQQTEHVEGLPPVALNLLSAVRDALQQWGSREISQGLRGRLRAFEVTLESVNR